MTRGFFAVTVYQGRILQARERREQKAGAGGARKEVCKDAEHTGAVGAEVLEDLGEGVGGHERRELKQVVARGDDRVVGARLAAVEGGLLRDTLVHDTLGEHGLVLRAHDERAELQKQSKMYMWV